MRAFRYSWLFSEQDASVNCIARTSDGGMVEARYVQRDPNYFIVYLSSHTGCAHTCRFCHLTAMNQRMMKPMLISDYLDQAQEVFEVYRKKLSEGLVPVDRVNFNFMARGEPLSNPNFVGGSQKLFDALRELARANGIEKVKFNVSSIFPTDGPEDLTQVLSDPDSELYYSLYSLNRNFRKRWLPHALHPRFALRRIAHYQAATGRRSTLHWAFIRNQNDSPDDVERIVHAVKRLKLNVKFNLVRYNPYDARYGTESPIEVLHARFLTLSTAFKSRESRMVPRVGFDVKASCGMFVAQ